jgi:hypothetical protein
MLTLAIDPGKTIGMAYKHPEDGTYITAEYTEKNDLWSLLERIEWDTVVYERFMTGGRISSAGLYTVGLVGVIEYICQTKKIPAYGYTPQMKIAFAKPAKEILGRGHSDHELDALALLLRWEYDQSKNL